MCLLSAVEQVEGYLKGSGRHNKSACMSTEEFNRTDGRYHAKKRRGANTANLCPFVPFRARQLCLDV